MANQSQTHLLFGNSLFNLFTLCQGEDETQSQSMDFLRFDFATVRAATKDFSNGNKLGGGGFGSVYKVIKPSSFLLLA